MKRFLRYFTIAIICCSILASCEKDSDIGSMKDLLGTYSVTVKEDVFWGADSGTLYDSGIITITQISKDMVQLSGLISTQGTLIDGKLHLSPETNSDSYGFLRTTYTSALFAGGILTIWSKVSGQLATTPYGVRYPFSSLRYSEGEKVD